MELTVTQLFAHYINEWVIPEKCDLYRIRLMAKLFIGYFGPKRLLSTITRNDLRVFIDFRLAQGRSPGTARRELSCYFAACGHEVREERIQTFARIKLPPSGPPRTRSFEDYEVQRLFAQPMKERFWRFLWIDFESAQRSRAIEELTTGRIDFKLRLMDFRVPGVNYKKKRRGMVAISDALLPVLQEAVCRFGPPWKDDLVVGLGPSGRNTETYHGVHEIVKAAGLYERWVCRHVGRKTWATQAAIAGTTDIEIATVLHDTPETVRKHYALPKAEKMLPVMNRHRREMPGALTPSDQRP